MQPKNASLSPIQLVRDLTWSVESPSLIDSHEPIAESFDEHEVDVQELQTFMRQCESRRVGVYFENLICFWLTRVLRLELVARGTQVIQDNRTVGEIDFLFYDHQHRLTHLETAVKFYLHAPEQSPSQYIGPNAADTFEKKMGRLFEHQLPLSGLSFPDVTRRMAWVKGRIFYHPRNDPPSKLPPRLSASHLRETWISEHELTWLDQQDHKYSYRVLAKPYWLSADVTACDANDLMDVSELKGWIRNQMASRPHPILISVLHRRQPDARELNELRRVFVVSRSWPSRRDRQN